MAVSQWMVNGMGSMFRVLCRWEAGVPRVITDDSETLRLDNLEYEVVRGVCGTPDSAIHCRICLLWRIP